MADIRRRRGAAQGLLALAAILAVILGGCGQSSPRFRSSEAARLQAEEDESRFAERIRGELSREDDVKPAPETAQRLLRSRRSDSAEAVSGLRDRLLLEVVGHLGTRYRYGGNGADGIDCSGFTSAVYRGAGLALLPRSTQQQFETGTSIPASEMQTGDLVFFNTTGRSPSHVGIYLEDGLFAHASVTAGVTISSLSSTYYRKRFVGVRRLIHDRL